ncbi:MotE family protein [Pseudooceanicola sp. LIPI14-2-Ac024]|uniref:MotE family protein n=1 Tax=Pseudooceanicola sp. LIPI14-2-Ac024 TaxID=3344875 RepID=UPI0035CEF211
MRPLPFIIGGLGLAVTAKLGIALMGAAPEPPSAGLPRDTLFLAAADAAGPAAEPEPAAPVMLAAAEPAQCETPEEMLRSIRKERELLAEQKDKLAQRTAELDLAAQTVEVERGKLAELKTELDDLLARVARAHTADVDRLVNLYRNMKPKDAASIMDDLDIEVTVMVLGTMEERDAAPILAALNPVRARAVSQIILLAGPRPQP